MYKFVFMLICCLFYMPSSIYGQKNEVVVVIDAGHGGHDPGHLSENSLHLSEKNLNLKIALFLGGYLQKYLQHVKVIYTRTSDNYPSLDERVGTANSNRADYFLSIHCNGNERSTVHGTETHVNSLSNKKSVALASEIEEQFAKRAGRKSRGVKDERDLQHSLQVLKYTNMTSVLVECGFITNTKEAHFLNTTYGQEIIASAIFRALRSTMMKEFPNISFLRDQPEERPIAAANNESTFCIQIMSSKVAVNTDDPSFKRLKMPVTRKELNTTSVYKYIYTVGDFASRRDAKNELPNIQERGYKDAIIIRR